MKRLSRTVWTLASATWWLLGGAIHPAAAQRPLNLDFERSSVSNADHPWGWTFGWSAFAGGPAASFSLDSTVHREGQRSLRIERPDSFVDASPEGIILQLPSEFLRGREIRLTGWARTTGLRGRAILTLEAWKDREFAAADTTWSSPDAAAVGSGDWAGHEVRIHVPDDPTVHSVVITLALEGDGTVWFDDLALFADGMPLTTLPGAAEPPAESELAWLARHAALLREVQTPVNSTPDDTDLRLVGDIVGEAGVVGLGESTHGTHEFFQVKHRLLEYLVRELGFGVFAIEANQLAVERVNVYVQGGSGTARDAMRVMFRVWNTEEMLALVEWMRAYNTAHPTRPVRFIGYDMQDHRVPADTLRTFLERTEPSLLDRFDELTGEYRAQPSFATPQIADTVRARWARQAEGLWDLVSGRRSAWLARASNRADTLQVEWAVQAANLLRQAARFNVALSSPQRDSLMAANLDWALRTLTPDARAVVWAHDVHVSHGGDPTLSFNGGAQMGAYVRRYGYDYRALTLLTYDGAYTATRSFSDHSMIEAEAFPAPSGSMEAALHDLERPEPSVGWVVDLRPARTDDGGAWLRRPRPIRHIGYTAYDYGFELTAVLPLEFDGVVFIDRTSASRLLR
jgi:erythromycin esterase